MAIDDSDDMPTDDYNRKMRALLDLLAADPIRELRILSVWRLQAFLTGWLMASQFAPEVRRRNCRLSVWLNENFDPLFHEVWFTYVINRYGDGEEGFYIALDLLFQFMDYNDNEEKKNETLYASGRCEPGLPWKCSPEEMKGYSGWHQMSVRALMEKICVRTPLYTGSWSLSQLDAYLLGWSLGSSDPCTNRHVLREFFNWVERRYSSNDGFWWEGIETVYGESKEAVDEVARLSMEFEEEERGSEGL